MIPHCKIVLVSLSQLSVLRSAARGPLVVPSESTVSYHVDYSSWSDLLQEFRLQICGLPLPLFEKLPEAILFVS